jgi:hypothetical protein
LTESLRDALMQAAAQARDYPSGRFSGRGIVVCAGGPVMLTNAYVLIRALRELLDCSAPIEVWHLGAREMPPLMATTFTAMGCRIVDARAVAATCAAEVNDGWQLKILALTYSSFEEVFLLDADQVPLIDPARVFDWPQYQASGAVFWPDIVDLAATNPVWQLVGLEPRQVRSWESGQICANKAVHWQALAVALQINLMAEAFYELIYGDKDAYLLAWLMTSATCALVPHPPMADLKYLGQRDFEGAVVFQHRTNCKWSLHEPPVRPDGFRLQAECERFLGDLRRFWNGRIFEPPDRSAAARRLERELIAQRRFVIVEAGERPTPIELLSGHQIGEGRSYRLANWYVGDADGGYQLVFTSHVAATLVMSRVDAVAWAGSFYVPVQRDAILTPAGGTADLAGSLQGGLVDEFVEAAMRGPPGTLDVADLEGALTLLARIEQGVAERVVARAERCETDHPELAGHLRAIADRLVLLSPDGDAQPERRAGVAFEGSRFYVRP